jgi:hypothetical protein
MSITTVSVCIYTVRVCFSGASDGLANLMALLAALQTPGAVAGPDSLIKEAAQGHAGNVQMILNQFPQKVEKQLRGRLLINQLNAIDERCTEVEVLLMACKICKFRRINDRLQLNTASATRRIIFMITLMNCAIVDVFSFVNRPPAGLHVLIGRYETRQQDGTAGGSTSGSRAGRAGSVECRG